MRLRLVVPADVDSPTGGNVYDLAVAAALRSGGDEVEVVPCRPDELADVLRRPWSGPTVVDGLLACPAPDVVAESRAAVLVHMPRAWEDGLTPEQAHAAAEQEQQALLAATTVVSTSHWSAAYLHHRHELHDVVVATPGVEPALVERGSDPLQLVQVAALLPNKDQLNVIEALTRLRDLPWRLRLVGSVDRHPAYAEAVRAAVTRGGVEDRVELVGELPRDVAWVGADLGLLPSRAEAFGLVVIEALARGVPVLVTDGGAAEALGLTPDGRRPGIVVPAGDVGAMTDALRGWMTDSARRDDLRRRALTRRASLHGWDVTARCLRDALSDR